MPANNRGPPAAAGVIRDHGQRCLSHNAAIHPQPRGPEADRWPERTTSTAAAAMVRVPPGFYAALTRSCTPAQVKETSPGESPSPQLRNHAHAHCPDAGVPSSPAKGPAARRPSASADPRPTQSRTHVVRHPIRQPPGAGQTPRDRPPAAPGKGPPTATPSWPAWLKRKDKSSSSCAEEHGT